MFGLNTLVPLGQGLHVTLAAQFDEVLVEQDGCHLERTVNCHEDDDEPVAVVSRG